MELGLPLAAFLAERGRILPNGVDVVALVGGGYILGYLGWLALKLFTTDGKTPPIDADSERSRRRAGVAVAFAALIYALIRSETNTGFQMLHRPMALLGGVAAFAVGNFTGALTGIVARGVYREESKENSIGGFQTLLQGVVLAVVFVAAWALAGAGEAAPPPNCHRNHNHYVRRLEHRHPRLRILSCKQPIRSGQLHRH